MLAEAPNAPVPEVVMAFPDKPSTVTARLATVSKALNPVPDTLMVVPFGPDDVPKDAVGAPAAAANETSGAAIAMMRSAVSTATVDFLYLLKLLIFSFSPIWFNPFFHRVKVKLWVSRYLILL
jgi:hypothetical protein